jgi:hypothetical protein
MVSDSVQTAYDKSNPFWTVTFHYHTQNMFNALYSAADEEKAEEELARVRKST